MVVNTKLVKSHGFVITLGVLTGMSALTIDISLPDIPMMFIWLISPRLRKRRRTETECPLPMRARHTPTIGHRDAPSIVMSYSVRLVGRVDTPGLSIIVTVAPFLCRAAP